MQYNGSIYFRWNFANMKFYDDIHFGSLPCIFFMLYITCRNSDIRLNIFEIVDDAIFLY